MILTGQEGASTTLTSPTIYIRNTRNDRLEWAAKGDTSWLQLALSRGSLEPNQGHYVGVTAKLTGLRGGRYQASITVTAPGAQGSPATVNVLLIVVPRSEMVAIPAGSFQMGDSFGEGRSIELPVHTVFVSLFFIDKYEVTKALWDDVASWAAAHGYDITPADGDGNAVDHPVQKISWYEAVKWANARSEKDGMTPVYYTSVAQSEVYRRGNVDVQNEWVRWSASGYRLPTEAEWEKAARGGVSAHRFPWSDSDTIQHARANYNSDSRISYDTSPTRGAHPSYTTGSSPYTSPVGSFAANGYGLYDMAGNVKEWVWDVYDYKENYYSVSPGSDPRGPASGSDRVLRGGSWLENASECRVAYRGLFYAPNQYSYWGFRLVRAAP